MSFLNAMRDLVCPVILITPIDNVLPLWCTTCSILCSWTPVLGKTPQGKLKRLTLYLMRVKV